MTVRRAQYVVLHSNNVTCPTAVKRRVAALRPKQLSLPRFLKPQALYIYPDL